MVATQPLQVGWDIDMPLVKSKNAFRKNVAAEVKPVKQAVAIAYSTKRSAAAKKGGMSKGKSCK
jgi:hypothetical protein